MCNNKTFQMCFFKEGLLKTFLKTHLNIFLLHTVLSFYWCCYLNQKNSCNYLRIFSKYLESVLYHFAQCIFDIEIAENILNPILWLILSSLCCFFDCFVWIDFEIDIMGYCDHISYYIHFKIDSHHVYSWREKKRNLQLTLKICRFSIDFSLISITFLKAIVSLL